MMHGLIAPPQFIADEFSSDNDVILFFDEYYEHKGVRFSYSYNKESDYSDLYDLVRDELYESKPTFCRWNLNPASINTSINDAVFKSFLIAIVLKKFEVEKLYFFTSIPHHVKTEMFCSAGKVLNINSVFLYNSVFGSRLIPIEQWGRVLNRKILPFKEGDANAFRKEIEDFFINAKRNLPPKVNVVNNNYTESFFSSFLVLLYLKLFRNKDDFLSEVILLLNQKSYLKKYNRLASNSSLPTESDIIIAAHYQPEATTFPEGLPYSNHLEIISKIKTSDFKGRIYYKEHPATKNYFDDVIGMSKVGLYRDDSYCDFLCNHGVTILPFDFDINHEDIEADVLTITGTIALERSFLKKKTIVCGTPWYGMPPYCSSLDDFLNEKPVETGDIKNYLNDLVGSNSIENNIGIGKPNIYKLDFDQFIANFKKLVEKTSSKGSI